MQYFHGYDFGMILIFCVFDSVIGSVLIIGGLYTVVGKRREAENDYSSKVKRRNE